MSRWSKNMADRIRHSKKRKELLDKKHAQDKETCDNGLETEWRNLSARLQAMCAELNEELHGDAMLSFEGKQDKVIVSRVGSPARIEGRASLTTHEIEFTGKRADGNNLHNKFVLKLTGSRDGWYMVDVEDVRGRSLTPEEIADSIVAALAMED